MDFALTDEQHAIVELATQIFTDLCAPEKLREVESGADWFHRDLWRELAKAELLGIPLPEAAGGAGFGFLEACLLLEVAGRAVAPVPLQPTLVAAMAIAELGTGEATRRWLPGVLTGDTVLTLALAELDADVRDPQVQAVADGDGWVLEGTKTTVPAMHLAAAVLVTARTSDGEVAVFVVPTDADGVTAERQDTFNHEPQFHVELAGVRVAADDRLGGDDPLGWVVDRATVGLCALAVGVAHGDVKLTAGYVTERKQFDRPIGSFQAVGHRMADCYIDDEAMRLSMLAAGSRLADGAPADKEVAVAKYWASFSGSRIGHAGLHLHGGISIDLDYPMHRYFLWAKQLEYTLGAGTAQLAHLGGLLADEPVGVI
ncbi:MAG: acyl-CoA dehydrogenase family protein [Acidimicrobiales bacterium]